MNQLLAAALDRQRFLTSRGRELCIIDGLALQRWGQPRQTADVDVTLLTEIGDRLLELRKQLDSEASS